MSEASPPAYDPVELRRRIVVCFSIPELRQLADSLGVGGSIAWERGPAEAVRELVKHSERYSGLEVLVAKLRELRPLVEWPEPSDAAAPVPITIAGVPLEVVQEATAPPAPPAAPSSPGDRPELFAPVPGAPAQPARPAAAPVWPGTVADSPKAPPSRGLDPRVLVLVAGLTVLAAVVAYLAGRSSNAPQATAPEGAAVVARRADGPATRAADALSRGVSRVARACEIAPGAQVFKRVFERCGPVPPPSRVRAPAPSPSDPQVGDPNPRDPDPPPPEPAKPRRPQKTADPADPPDAPQSKNCIGRCDAEHRSCKTSCGAEPTDASKYDGYQQCLVRCLSGASRCRLACK